MADVRKPRLNAEAIKALREHAEAAWAMAEDKEDRQFATSLSTLLDWHDEAALTRPAPSPSDAESNLRSCNICGFTIDLARGHTKPSISFTMAGRRGAGDKAETGPKIDLSSLVAEVMQKTWDDICADTHCHPLDITHEGRNKALSFHPDHWVAAIARNLSNELARMRGAAVPDELMNALATLFHGYCRPEDGPQKFSMVVSPDWSWTGRNPLDCVKAWDIVQGVLYPAAPKPEGG